MIALKAALYAGVIFLILDILWLGVIARGFFQSQLGDLLRTKIQLAPAVAFYVIYIAALVWFAILPGVEKGWQTALLNGAFLGLAAYATYDLTNLAVIKGYPMPMALVDMAWGTALSAAAAVGATLLLKVW